MPSFLQSVSPIPGSIRHCSNPPFEKSEKFSFRIHHWSDERVKKMPKPSFLIRHWSSSPFEKSEKFNFRIHHWPDEQVKKILKPSFLIRHWSEQEGVNLPKESTLIYKKSHTSSTEKAIECEQNEEKVKIKSNNVSKKKRRKKKKTLTKAALVPEPKPIDLSRVYYNAVAHVSLCGVNLSELYRIPISLLDKRVQEIFLKKDVIVEPKIDGEKEIERYKRWRTTFEYPVYEVVALNPPRIKGTNAVDFCKKFGCTFREFIELHTSKYLKEEGELNKIEIDKNLIQNTLSYRVVMPPRPVNFDESKQTRDRKKIALEFKIRNEIISVIGEYKSLANELAKWCTKVKISPFEAFSNIWKLIGFHILEQTLSEDEIKIVYPTLGYLFVDLYWKVTAITDFSDSNIDGLNRFLNEMISDIEAKLDAERIFKNLPDHLQNKCKKASKELNHLFTPLIKWLSIGTKISTKEAKLEFLRYFSYAINKPLFHLFECKEAPQISQLKKQWLLGRIQLVILTIAAYRDNKDQKLIPYLRRVFNAVVLDNYRCARYSMTFVRNYFLKKVNIDISELDKVSRQTKDISLEIGILADDFIELLEELFDSELNQPISSLSLTRLREAAQGIKLEHSFDKNSIKAFVKWLKNLKQSGSNQLPNAFKELDDLWKELKNLKELILNFEDRGVDLLEKNSYKLES